MSLQTRAKQAQCREGVLPFPEGHFFEAVNAIGVLQIPVIISVWDDGYGISVSNEYQMTKSDVSEVLKGFQRTQKKDGLEIK